jgi:hypothetical protein
MQNYTVKLNQKVKDVRNHGNAYDYSIEATVKVFYSQYGYFIFHNNPGNCKICTISKVQGAQTAETRKALTDRLKEFFSVGTRKYAFRITCTDENTLKMLRKHFTPIYVIKLPIGDSDTDQFHGLYKTNSYKDREEFKKYDGILKNPKHKRKILITESIKPIKNCTNKKRTLTDAQIAKIKSYKRKDFLVKYVSKLINGETV